MPYFARSLGGGGVAGGRELMDFTLFVDDTIFENGFDGP
jgi:hypothetical protein